MFGVTNFDWTGSLYKGNLWKPFDRLFGSDDGPCVQLVDSNGNYSGQTFFGFPQSFLERPGKVRLSDGGFLSDGNLVFIAEDRQNLDGSELYNLEPKSLGVHGLDINDRLVLGSIVSRQGKVLNGPFLIQQAEINKKYSTIWHGLAIGNGHFGVRYEANGVKIRFFHNDGTPLTDEIPLQNEMSHGGRGDRSGWKGNGRDDYLLVTPTGDHRVFASVMNQFGKPKYPSIPIDSISNYGSCDGDIDPEGNFIVVADYFPGEPNIDKDRSVTCARFFNWDGTAKTLPFYLTSVKPEDWVVNDGFPRVAMRCGLAVVMWMDRNTNLPEKGKREIGLRIFKTPF